jgi:hypothetical protein
MTKRKYTYIQGIECLLCEDRIFSMFQHDFRWCKCKKCYVDGGRSYMRIGGDPNNYKMVRRRLYEQ